MLTCPYDSHAFKHYSGLSAHMRKLHPDKWHHSIASSLPEGRDMASLGSPEGHPLKGKPPNSALTLLREARGERPKKKRLDTVDRVFPLKGGKKKPVKSSCPYCSYVTSHPPALANHIKGNHPNEWAATQKKERKRQYDRKHWHIKHADERRAKIAAAKVYSSAKCLWCDFVGPHMGSLGMHIRKTHPNKWEGSVAKSYGRKGAPLVLAMLEEKRERQRLYQQKWGADNRERIRVQHQNEYRRKRGMSPLPVPPIEQAANGAQQTPIPRRGPAPIVRAHIDYCPKCGANLQAMGIALGMLEGREHHEASSH